MFRSVFLLLFFLFPSLAMAEDDCTRYWCGPSSICCGTPTSPPPCPFANPKLCLMNPIPPAFSGGILRGDGTIALPLPPVVALESATGNTVCSGTLISDNKVLTASHCFCNESIFGLKPSDIVYGADTGENAIRFPIESVSFFSQKVCDAFTQASSPDIAVVTIDQPYSLEPSAIAQIDWGVSDYSGPGLIAGFGTSDTNKEGGVKEMFEYQDMKLCGESERSVIGCIPGADIVATVPIGNIGGGCQGDSGAPVFGVDGEIVGVIKSGLLVATAEENEICGNGDVATFLGQKTTNSAGQSISDWLNRTLEVPE